MKFIFTWIASVLLLIVSGSSLFSCQATTPAQWMGAVFFVGWMSAIFYAFREGNRRAALLAFETIRENIRKGSFEMNVAVTLFWIVYVFSLLFVGLLAYNTNGFDRPYGTLYVILTLFVLAATCAMYKQIGTIEGRLDAVERAEEDKREEERAKEEEKREEEERRFKNIMLSLSPDEISMMVAQRQRKTLENPD